ncbi:PREDICTED: uncharacterized protein LOC109477288 [Branchiostoma belcheri]|uniref:Uncharacterized protein LOC109477288 n=1 Tax=Branchiostoma belcheri TaxID=7741 RepID=A0A6P4ZSL8_BRABE|nr:PREDICTED: uncharacterized protein LOC109477288 [Branchiostoma belcheri]
MTTTSVYELYTYETYTEVTELNFTVNATEPTIVDAADDDRPVEGKSIPSVALIWVLITSGIFLVSILVSQTCQYLVNHTNLLVPYRQRDEFPSDAESYDIPVANGTDHHMPGIAVTPEKETPFTIEEIVEMVTYQIRANNAGGKLPYSLDDKRRHFAVHGKDSGFSETEDMDSVVTVSSDGTSQPSLVLETLPIPDNVMNPPGSPGQSVPACLCNHCSNRHKRQKHWQKLQRQRRQQYLRKQRLQHPHKYIHRTTRDHQSKDINDKHIVVSIPAENPSTSKDQADTAPLKDTRDARVNNNEVKRIEKTSRKSAGWDLPILLVKAP